MIERPIPRRSARARVLQDFLHDCVASSPAEQAIRLAEAVYVLRPGTNHAALEAMVACGAYESAAFLILGHDRPFLISRGASGLSIASAVFADGSEEATAEAATPALALLAANAAALLADEGRAAVTPRRAGDAAAPRLH
jgi:hypothetical protein